jgi:hypothetical protein
VRYDGERTIGLELTNLAKFTLPGRGSGKEGAEGKTCALQARNWRVLHPGEIGSFSNSGK